MRLVLIGTLEAVDLPVLTRTFTESLKTAEDVRIVLLKLWHADRDSFRVLRHHAKQARALGVDCVWAGALPEAENLLAELDEKEHVVVADAGDFQAVRGWGHAVGRSRDRREWGWHEH